MGIGSVRQYFRDRMNFLGYEEWRDGFNFENIPSSIIDKSFHIESGVIESSASNHQPHQFLCPLTVRVFMKGFRDPSDAIDTAFNESETILGEVLLPGNRLGSVLQDIRPINIQVSPVDQSNDNSIILQFDFEALTYMKF